MKKIKLVLSIVLFGAMGFGAFTAYEHYTMTEDERFMMENIDALTEYEGDGGIEIYKCYQVGTEGNYGYWLACDVSSTKNRRCASVHFDGRTKTSNSECYK